MYWFDEGDRDITCDTCLAMLCVVHTGLVKVTQTLRLIPACCNVCHVYWFGGDDTDTTSDTCLAVTYIVVCTGLMNVSQILCVIPILL